MIPLTPRKFSGDKMKKQINVRFPKSVNLIEWSNYDDLTCFTSLDLKLLNLAPLKAAPAPPQAISHGPPGNLTGALRQARCRLFTPPLRAYSSPYLLLPPERPHPVNSTGSGTCQLGFESWLGHP